MTMVLRARNEDIVEKSERQNSLREREILPQEFVCGGKGGESERERERSLERAFLSGHSNKDKD